MSDKVTNIDYGTIPEDIKKLQESISKTVSRFTNYRKSLNYKTQEEKTEEMYRKAKEDQANIPEDMNSEDVYMWYNNYQRDPKKQAEFRQQGAQTAGLLMTIPMTIASAGTMGWIPALTSTATGIVGGYGGYKAGEYLDKKYDTNWIASALGFVGGMAGGITGYKGLVRAGSNGLLKGKGNLYGKSFMGDVMADMAKSTEIATPSYGKVKYYGPTMGKTTAAKTNTNLVDFDDYVRPELEQLASELGITRQQLMMSQDPTIREKARQLMLKSIDGWKKNSGNDGKTLVISKSDILQDPVFDNQPLVLQRDEFLKRNAARGETDLQNSMDWYASTRRKGGDKLMEWPDPEGVYISELEPFTPDPHKITLPTSTEITLLSMQDMIPTKFTSIPHLKPLGGKINPQQ